MSYPYELKEFVKVRMEQTSNNTQIARDLKNKFNLDKTVEKIRKGVFFKHLFAKKEPEQHWPSDFEAELLFHDCHCHICKAKFLQWCKHCNSIFCHLSKEEYAPKNSYNCPECGARYGWGESFGAKPKTLFDAKDLRSIGYLQ